ncbi:MAG: EutN/CcmL family microcompartment protein [Vicinamibacterales bacterium]
MQIARVVGTVVATRKHPKFEGAKLLLVQPVTLDDRPRGVPLLAVDAVGAGVHERVVIVIEGRAAGEALGRKGAPVDAAVIGIVDELDVIEDDTSVGRRGSGVRAGAEGSAGTPSRPETRGPS